MLIWPDPRQVDPCESSDRAECRLKTNYFLIHMSDPTAKRDSSVRVGPMTNVVHLLSSLSVDPFEVLNQVGLHPIDLEDPNHRLDYHQADNLLTECKRQTNCPHFGLLLGQRAEPWHLGVAGLVVYVAPTVRHALEGVAEMIDLHDDGTSVSLEIGRDYARFSFIAFEPGVMSIEVINDLSATIMCQILRVMCGPLWNPSAVFLPRRKPVNPIPHNRFFRAPIHFDSTELALTFENRWLDFSPATSDQSRYRQIKRASALLHDEAHRQIIDTLPITLRRGMLMGAYSAREVSSVLGMHERTLNRRLAAVGTSFRQELDSARRSFAEQLLEATNMHVADVAHALGYRHASSFIRAFERWLGISPSLWRQQFKTEAALSSDVEEGVP